MALKTTVVAAVLAFGVAALASHFIFRGAEPARPVITSQPGVTATGPS